MKNKLKEKLANMAVSHNIINSDDKEIYYYGLNKLLSSILGIIISIIIGLMLNMLEETILFTISYMILRSYAGGYHANNQTKCYILSTAIVVLALKGVTYTYKHPRICIGMLALSCIPIILFAPIESKNKPLNNMEKISHKKASMKTLITLVILTLLFLSLNLQTYMASIAIAITSVSIMLLLGKYNP